MAEIFTLDNLFTLGMLVLLQAVLGFDNLLYISLESKRAPEDQQAKVRRFGIGLAIGLRIILLLVLVKLIEYFQDPISWLTMHTKPIDWEPNFHSLIVLVGGAFIIYTATKEIFHMLAPHDWEEESSEKNLSAKSSFGLS